MKNENFEGSDLPGLEVSSSVDYMIFRAVDRFISSLSSVNASDPRPYLLINSAINVIPDAAWRVEIKKTMRELRKQYNVSDIGSPEAHALAVEMLAPITDWQAKYRGTIKNTTIGTV